MLKRAVACLAAAVVVVAGLAVRAQAPPPDGDAAALRETAAIAALDRYLETWNSRDAALWATSLHFPHVRPGPGAFELSRTAEEYAAGVDFARTVATGWDHTEWVSRRVLQSGPDKAHVAGVWQRYGADGRPLATSAITYIVSREGDRWGVLSRFAAGAGRVPSDQREAVERAAADAVRAFFEAWNSHDPDWLAAAIHYPHVRIADGAVRVWESPQAFLAGPEPGRQRTWFETTIDSLEVAQIAPTGANVAVTYSRRTRDGSRLAQYRGGVPRHPARGRVAGAGPVEPRPLTARPAPPRQDPIGVSAEGPYVPGSGTSFIRR